MMHRGYSRRCQKLTTDFGIEESFSKAAVRMYEHHGVEISATAVRRITERHAKRAQQVHVRDKQPLPTHQQLVLEMDGEMVPLVTTRDDQQDRRKTRQCLWSELRLGAVKRVDQIGWKYVVSFRSPEELGDRMKELLEKSFHWKGETKLYGVGDGANWIIEQLERIAGSQYWYTIDLYHLCEYLTKAASSWSQDVKSEVKRIKERLKSGQIGEVLEELKKRIAEIKDHEGLRKCIQYIENRPGQFEYKKALANDLPIGSGKIESSHRHVIQSRLKKAGAWWKRENARAMAELRVLRANGHWSDLWQENQSDVVYQQAA